MSVSAQPSPALAAWLSCILGRAGVRGPGISRHASSRNVASFLWQFVVSSMLTSYLSAAVCGWHCVDELSVFPLQFVVGWPCCWQVIYLYVAVCGWQCVDQLSVFLWQFVVDHVVDKLSIFMLQFVVDNVLTSYLSFCGSLWSTVCWWVICLSVAVCGRQCCWRVIYLSVTVCRLAVGWTSLNVLVGCVFALQPLFGRTEWVSQTPKWQYILSFALCAQKFAHGNFWRTGISEAWTCTEELRSCCWLLFLYILQLFLYRACPNRTALFHRKALDNGHPN